MESSLHKPEPISHVSFITLAEKSIGCSISVPVLHKKHKNLFGEERFKVSVDKRVTALYVQLLQNRVSKLKREEQIERKKLEYQEQSRDQQKKVHQRKIEDEEEIQKNKESIKKKVDTIKEQIKRFKDEHEEAMNDIKKQSSQMKTELNKKRKEERMKHERIKSLFIESSRESNWQRAKIVKESIKKIETTRAASQVQLKIDLHQQYLAKIEQDRHQKAEFEAKLKFLESEEMSVLHRLGKTYSTSV